jgi:hypothetical protein
MLLRWLAADFLSALDRPSDEWSISEYSAIRKPIYYRQRRPVDARIPPT